MFAAAWWYYGPGWLLAVASHPRLRADRAVRHRPRTSAACRTSSPFPASSVGFAFSFVTGLGWVSSLIGIAIGGGLLLAIAEAYYRLRHEEGLGMGDVKMLAMIGAFLGWPATLMTLMMGSIAGSIVGVADHRAETRRHEIRAAVRDVSRDGRGALGDRRPQPVELVSGLLVTSADARVTRQPRAQTDRCRLTPSALYALLGLTVIVGRGRAALVLCAAQIHRRRRARGRRQRGRGETSLLSAALAEAVAKLQAQERATAARAEASERMSGRDHRQPDRRSAGGRPGRRRAHPQSRRSPHAARPRTGAAQRLPPAARRAGAVGHHRRVLRHQRRDSPAQRPAAQYRATVRRTWA